MKLFHYTSEPWWILIANTGEILSYAEKRNRGLATAGATKTIGSLGGGSGAVYVQTSAPVSSEWDVRIDELVWLTPWRDPAQEWQTPAMGIEPHHKGAIRIEVDPPNLVRWPTHARHIGFPKEYYRALDETGGRMSKLWWVSLEPIGAEHWVRVERTSDGTVLYDRELAGRT